MTPRTPDPIADSSRPLGMGSLLPFLLYGTGQLVEREVTRRLAEVGMTMRTLGVLGHLASSPDLSYSDLARRSQVTVQTMHTTVRKLIDDGCVRAVGTSGQAARLTVTTTGRARAETARQVLIAYENELLTGADLPRGATRTTLLALTGAAWRSTTAVT